MNLDFKILPLDTMSKVSSYYKRIEYWYRELEKNTVGVASVVICLLLWESAVRVGIMDSPFLPAPTMIILKTWDLLLSGVLSREIAATMQRISVGFGLGVLIGTVAAILCNTFKVVEYALVPLVELVRSVAPLALLPAFLLLFGIGFASKVAVIAWVVWVPIFLNTLQGMKSADPLLVKAARSIGSSKMQIAFKVILPSATPFIIAGLRLSMGSAFLVLVAAEMLGANTGLGFYILEASQTFKIVEMYSAIFVIAVIGISLNWVFLMVAHKLAPWHNLAE